MSKINVSTITNRTGTSGPVLSGVTTATNGFHVTGGSVGIGTDNPANDLVIESSGSGKGLAVRKNSVESTFLGHNGSGNEGLLILREGGNNKVQLYAESGQPSFINSGNVGIGTNNPLRNLHVHDDAAVTTAIQLTNAATGATNDNSGFTIKIGGVGQVNFDQRTTGQDIIVFTNAIERMRVGGYTGVTTFVKDVSISDGNLVVSNGKGIDFSATGQVTGMTNELLDDYEEGVYTVVMADTGTGTITVNSNDDQAQYVKVGNLVTVSGRPLVGSVSSPTGDLTISLPFTPASLSEAAERAPASLYMRLCDSSSDVGAFDAAINDGSAVLQFGYAAGGNDHVASGPRVQAGTQIWFSVTYRAA